MLAYYGYKHEVLDLLQKLTKDSRVYARSHHKILLVAALKEHRMEPYYGLPRFLTEVDIQKTERSKGSQHRNAILVSYNDKVNTNLA